MRKCFFKKLIYIKKVPPCAIKALPFSYFFIDRTMTYNVRLSSVVRNDHQERSMIDRSCCKKKHTIYNFIVSKIIFVLFSRSGKLFIGKYFKFKFSPSFMFNSPSNFNALNKAITSNDSSPFGYL